MQNPVESVQRWLMAQGLAEQPAGLVGGAGVAVAVLVAAFLLNLIARRVLVTAAGYLVSRSRSRWDDLLVERKVFSRLSHFVPALVFYFTANLFPEIEEILQRLSMAYMIFAGVSVLFAFLNAVGDIYSTFEVSRQRPIKGYLQLTKLIIAIFVTVFTLAMLMNRSPWLLLSGLGAMTAVLLLVFKDTILGLVASVQLSQNDMVRIGDWIEMPKYGADGSVIDVTLHTIKVQNWDKTITTIPAYSMISDSFKNWRGMSESGGRRIKRSIFLDMTSVRFVDDAMLERFRRYQLVRDHIDQRQREIDAWNREHHVDTSVLINGRRMTNLGVFRAYVGAYLRKHPRIHQEMTFLIRHLQPTDKGLPIEIYVFTNDIVWANYEGIQADIFDHILAVVPMFGLRVFQNPSSHDLQAAAGRVLDAAGAGNGTGSTTGPADGAQGTRS